MELLLRRTLVRLVLCSTKCFAKPGQITKGASVASLRNLAPLPTPKESFGPTGRFARNKIIFQVK